MKACLVLHGQNSFYLRVFSRDACFMVASGCTRYEDVAIASSRYASACGVTHIGILGRQTQDSSLG